MKPVHVIDDSSHIESVQIDVQSLSCHPIVTTLERTVVRQEITDGHDLSVHSVLRQQV